MAKKAVKITFDKFGYLPLHMMTPLQGDLKSLSKEDYERLKHEIITDGFSFPFAVWEDGPTIYIIDGHQRKTTLERMKSEGYELPTEFPVGFIKAKSVEQAKHKLLAAASQYGKVQEDGLMAFLKGVSFPHEELVKSFRLPEIDIHDFIDRHLSSAAAPDPLDLGAVVIGEGLAPAPEPVKVEKEQGKETTLLENESQVRMVQLFLDGKTHPEFLQKIAVLQKHFETANLTDTVLKVIREAHSALRKE